MNAELQSPNLAAGQSATAELTPFEALPRAHGRPLVEGLLRAEPGDFVVEERLSFTPDDQGSHCLLRVRKTSANTEWTARQLARIAEVQVRDIGYAGLKDRHAVAIQWFSVPIEQRPEPDWSPLANEGIEVLDVRRHGRKLRRGAIDSNWFEIRLRDVRGDPAALDERLARISDQGVPSYFGPQRFGRHGGNLTEADAWFRGRGRRLSRHQRGLLLSAVRSALFNQVLAERVKRGTWNQALVGDRLELAGSHSHFLVEQRDAAIHERLARWDVSPTGPLAGSGESLSRDEVAALEAAVLAPWSVWVDGLARAGLRQERRTLRVRPLDLSLQRSAADQLVLGFRLPAGAYATSVLREFASWSEPLSRGRGEATVEADPD